MLVDSFAQWGRKAVSLCASEAAEPRFAAGAAGAQVVTGVHCPGGICLRTDACSADVTHLAKESVLLVQAVEVLPGRDVELARIEVLATRRHAHHAALPVLQVRPDLVLKEPRLVAVQDPADEATRVRTPTSRRAQTPSRL